MSTTLEQFENMLQSNKQHGSAIRAAAKKHPHGYAEWVRGMIAGTPYTAAGFDLARARLEAAGLSRAEAMRECGRWHAGHGLWVEEQNTKRGSRQKQSGDLGTPAAASAAPGNSARSAGGKAYNARVATYLAEGLTRGQAMSKAKRDDPEAFFEWVADCNGQQEEPSAERHQNRRESAFAASPGVRIVDQPAQPQSARPATTIAAPQPAAPGAQAGAQQALGAADLAYMKKRWEHPAFRAVWGDNFDLLVKYNEGRISLEEAKSLREKTLSDSSRKLLKLGNSPATRPRGGPL